jgi:hypothetical protein
MLTWARDDFRDDPFSRSKRSVQPAEQSETTAAKPDNIVRLGGQVISTEGFSPQAKEKLAKAFNGDDGAEPIAPEEYTATIQAGLRNMACGVEPCNPETWHMADEPKSDGETADDDLEPPAVVITKAELMALARPICGMSQFDLSYAQIRGADLELWDALFEAQESLRKIRMCSYSDLREQLDARDKVEKAEERKRRKAFKAEREAERKEREAEERGQEASE